MSPICDYEWGELDACDEDEASTHICVLDKGHSGLHVCMCSAFMGQDS